MGSLAGHELRWHKRSSKDGSGKFSVVACQAQDSAVPGALFSIPAEERIHLDQAEGLGFGYDECEVTVTTPGGPRQAFTYVASPSHIDASLVPFSWYRDLAADGAAHLGLPQDHVAFLRRIPARHDADDERESEERTFIPCGRP